MRISNRDTIVALATPPGQSGLGVVRISGPESASVLSRVWKPKRSKELEHRKLFLGEIIDISGEALDTATAVFLPSPHTYTGDDVVEISCHGSPLLLEKLVTLCTQAGARLAEPGEFTRRAFLSGKMDLTQAEAVADVIHATSEAALRSAKEQLQGRLSREVKTLHDELLNLRAFVEACIDFPEEDIEMIEREGIAARLSPLLLRLEQFLSTFHRGRLLRDGVSVALIGKPNVGKSSLLNRLAGSERAIVHETPGTTRDVIEVSINLGGALFHLIDTAGIRSAPDAVERMGIERSREALERADIIIALFDASQVLTPEDEEVLSLVKEKQHILCFNKCDLSEAISKQTNIGVAPTPDPRGAPPAVYGWGGGTAEVTGPLSAKVLKWLPNAEPISISAKTGEGIEALFSKLQIHTQTSTNDASSVTITNVRHKEALVEASQALKEAQKSLQRRESAEFCAHHLRAAQEALGRIIGLDVSEELLDRIFSGFCIGK
ncbi:MAG: tRNA uridine-5-carboxymethylaminomethyl(34) synthesis GTPase MnmE [Deltaproteobacteria bacterium RIFCSPLOWO2_02_FULL_44_10]|nr:MAG: tRNA uridine-5-carboxymethylaminomethyl(34) synthesis GTPase MnmE [Deltaproteobacteria bacterium RIFCSPHIGHO2_02_FULL_44_16]OGQ47233.1 MAG: tRNA uridine-5-carboxymethylaminomethyl(34) synthesis GTPase MnmE [Deltaproteobacteria bacterium RIFCSPLOWO2_02_FULL_44_10]